MALSARAQKEAYLRRKGMKSPRATTSEPVYEELYPENGDRESGPSFAQKRKENLLSRARGGRPREVDVGITAVLFAAKLKRLSLTDRDPLGKKQTGLVGRSSGDRSSGERSSGEREPAERAPAEKTWIEKRKDTYLRTHHAAPPKATAVTLTAICFAAKLKARSPAARRRREIAERLSSSSGDGDPAATKATPNENREKSFAQKRKVRLDCPLDLYPSFRSVPAHPCQPLTWPRDGFLRRRLSFGGKASRPHGPTQRRRMDSDEAGPRRQTN